MKLHVLVEKDEAGYMVKGGYEYTLSQYRSMMNSVQDF